MDSLAQEPILLSWQYVLLKYGDWSMETPAVQQKD